MDGRLLGQFEQVTSNCWQCFIKSIDAGEAVEDIFLVSSEAKVMNSSDEKIEWRKTECEAYCSCSAMRTAASCIMTVRI